MRETERVSALIGNIYDAALDPKLWIDVLQKSSKFVGGPAASIYSRDAVSGAAFAAYQFGLEPRYVRLYEEKYAKVDPTLPGYFFAKIEEPTDVTDVMDYTEFLQTQFHKEWSQPQGIVDSLNAVLDRSATMAAMFVVFRHECDGLVDEEARRRMRLIVPHVRRAVLVSNVISYREAEALSFADVLDEISAGMFLVDGHGHIVHANVRGHALLAEGTLLHAVGQKLIAYDTSAEQALHDVYLAAGSGDAAVGTRAIALPLRARDGVHYVANVLPLTSGARSRTGINYQAVAAVFVQRAAMEASLPAEMIAKSYRLTATELRVLLAIVEVGGVPEVAKTLGIAETTIKTHLGHIFQKTETSRQVDLVKLVASFGSPFRS